MLSSRIRMHKNTRDWLILLHGVRIEFLIRCCHSSIPIILPNNHISLYLCLLHPPASATTPTSHHRQDTDCGNMKDRCASKREEWVKPGYSNLQAPVWPKMSHPVGPKIPGMARHGKMEESKKTTHKKKQWIFKLRFENLSVEGDQSKIDERKNVSKSVAITCVCTYIYLYNQIYIYVCGIIMIEFCVGSSSIFNCGCFQSFATRQRRWPSGLLVPQGTLSRLVIKFWTFKVEWLGGWPNMYEAL